MQSIHHRRNLPKTYETKRNRIGDEKREIRKKKLSGELNLHGDLHLSRARRQSQLSLADEDAVSRQRDGSLSLRRKQWSQRKKRERKRSEKTTSLPHAGKPDPSRRRARSLPPASPLSLAAARCLSPSLLTEKTMKEKRKKKERTRERERGDSEEKAISSGYGHGAEIEIWQRRETSLWLPRDLIQTKSCTHRSADPMVRKTSNMRGRNLMTDI